MSLSLYETSSTMFFRERDVAAVRNAGSRSLAHPKSFGGYVPALYTPPLRWLAPASDATLANSFICVTDSTLQVRLRSPGSFGIKIHSHDLLINRSFVNLFISRLTFLSVLISICLTRSLVMVNSAPICA